MSQPEWMLTEEEWRSYEGSVLEGVDIADQLRERRQKINRHMAHNLVEWISKNVIVMYKDPINIAPHLDEEAWQQLYKDLNVE